MKYSIIVASLFASLAYALPSDSSESRLEVSAPQSCGNPRIATPFYRSYNPTIIDHFYTTSRAEDRNAIGNLGYNDEGISSYIWPRAQPGTVPLYRLYSASATDHFYTTSAAERNSALGIGYASEGIAGYVYPSTTCGGVPLYRLYSASGTDHFYTTSAAERNSAQLVGYAFEGIAGYVLPY